MTTRILVTLSAVLLTLGRFAEAQQPPRPNETPRAVTLSLAEYNRLIDLANRPSQAAAVAPVAAVLASAELRVRAERETVRGAFNVTGDVLRPGVSRVSLLSGATLVDANAGGRPLPLIADGNAHTALVPGPGPFSLALEWGAPIKFTPGRASFVMPVPPTGTARATIDLPGDQADVRLSAGLITRRTVAAGRTIIEATLDPGSSTEVSWSMRDSAPSAAAREVRTLADVMTLITLGDSDVRMTALVDVTVVQGELRTIAVRLPSGYELTNVSGGSLASSEARDGGLVLSVGDPALRSHQFLVTLERAHNGGSFTIDTGFVSMRDVQRERGEVAVEGVGTLDVNAAERDGLHRIDGRELDRALQSLARFPVLSAFRYQRTSSAPPNLALQVKRFDEAAVLAAVADSAVATTLVTSEGRALTEVSLQVQNRAQPFLKLTLPAGATMVSVDVAGVSAKPVVGTDGIRVPLLRPGFRPRGAYQVSFVYLHAGTPFSRSGEIQMTLPRMDVPVGIVQWEVFAPDRYSVRSVGGNVIDATFGVFPIVNAGQGHGFGVGGGTGSGLGRGGRAGAVAGSAVRSPVRITLENEGLRGQIRGRAIDASGAVLPGVTIELQTTRGAMTAVTGGDGTFLLSGVAAGQTAATASLPGFTRTTTSFFFDERPRHIEFEMRVAGSEETVAVVGETPTVDLQQSTRAQSPQLRQAVTAEPSQNVINLQQRVSGVLPVRVDVPRAGSSHQFVKPLVVDQETVVKLRYKRR